MSTALDIANLKHDIDSRESKDAAYKEALRETESRLDDQVNRLQRSIILSSNPSPIMLAMIFVVVLVGLWFIHLVFIKPSMSGIWHEGPLRIYVDHNRMTDVIHVRYGDEWLPDGFITDNLVNIGGRIGVWDYRSLIYMLDGGRWQRLNSRRA